MRSVTIQEALKSGSALERRVWMELLRIPRGEVVAYAELARRVGKPKAVRAVASAVGRNPLPVTIPCHRVIRSDGGLGGYSGKGGVKRKRELLKKEGVCVTSKKPRR